MYPPIDKRRAGKPTGQAICGRPASTMTTSRLSVVNTRTGESLGDAIEAARTLRSRVIGLLGRDGLERSGGLWIEPCNSIHMFFMRFAIDVVFVDRGNQVTRTFTNLGPWRLARGGRKARGVLELPTGTIEQSGTKQGDPLAFDWL